MRLLLVTLSIVVLGAAFLATQPGSGPDQVRVRSGSGPEATEAKTGTWYGTGTGDRWGTGAGQVSAATPAARASAPPAAKAAEVQIPPALAAPAPINLPRTLELVALPSLPGAAAQASRSITRAEAVAAALTSRDFQETVTPLARLYLATFGRYPDYEGLNYYTGQREEARPLHEIAGEFVGSREFEQRYGTLDNAQFVELMFTNVLGHPSQAEVRNYWVEEINAGRMTRGQVLVDLAESGAFRERSANQVFVSTAYTEILRRTPDPAGYDYWVGQLRAGQAPRSVINGLLGSR
jgi:hypothetical protein